ncbi:MAG TPA: hypothetical protein PLC43_04205, partial [Caldisericia bacterium]|nr:hypothetical protein [Caldisericia bacterium]
MAQAKFEQIIETKLIAPNISDFEFFLSQFGAKTKQTLVELTKLPKSFYEAINTALKSIELPKKKGEFEIEIVPTEENFEKIYKPILKALGYYQDTIKKIKKEGLFSIAFAGKDEEIEKFILKRRETKKSKFKTYWGLELNKRFEKDILDYINQYSISKLQEIPQPEKKLQHKLKPEVKKIEKVEEKKEIPSISQPPPPPSKPPSPPKIDFDDL